MVVELYYVQQPICRHWRHGHFKTYVIFCGCYNVPHIFGIESPCWPPPYCFSCTYTFFPGGAIGVASNETLLPLTRTLTISGFSCMVATYWVQCMLFMLADTNWWWGNILANQPGQIYNDFSMFVTPSPCCCFDVSGRQCIDIFPAVFKWTISSPSMSHCPVYAVLVYTPLVMR